MKQIIIFILSIILLILIFKFIFYNDIKDNNLKEDNLKEKFKNIPSYFDINRNEILLEPTKQNIFDQSDHSGQSGQSDKTLPKKNELVNLRFVKKINPVDLRKITNNETPFLNVVQKDFKRTTLPGIRTYLELPEFKGYNLEKIDKLELVENNTSKINYGTLKKDQAFTSYNSTFYQ